MRLPKALEELINSFEQLPGIGPKTAARLSFYLLHTPQGYLDSFGQAVINLKKNTVECSFCHNVAQSDPCLICQDKQRNQKIICVVEQPMDLLSIERTNQFRGVYHVLHGAINPLQSIGPEEINIDSLIRRIEVDYGIEEIILATNSGMEGEATAMYLKRELVKINQERKSKFRISRMGQGLPVGADLEYADEATLRQALEGRRSY
ncbi:MAG: recombination mediator RecR [Candidatus Shapirobacteria bacterium]|nr:recombination mediator RecR [Candidatus Shapirobacteria bacterium]MDD5073802.1 recombination mediator RecR [Candidatus Shapirobacteria bacterium]MDD5481513.1 recombination mediator RecR [Candidatus Shapirobacteria bacterium]